MSASIWSPGTTPLASVNGAMVRQEFTATAAQTLFTLTQFAYEIGTESLLVFQNGVLLDQTEVAETSSSSFTLATGATLNDKVVAVGFTEVVGTIPVVDIVPATIGASKFVKVDAGATAFEGRTAAQVLSDIGAEPADGTIIKAADIGTSVQAFDAQLAELAAIVPAQGDIIYYDGADWVALNAGTSGNFLKTMGAGANPQWALPPSAVVQVVEATPLTTKTDCAVVILYDDSIPQNTEGTQILTVSITPTNASNRLRVDIDVPLVGISAADPVILALFQDAIAGALAASATQVTQNGAQMHLTYEMAAGTTSAITFKARLGPNSGTAYVNGEGAAGNRRLGGASAARMRVTEIKA